ncbi:hypothetical protein IMG5_190580 [Ichthyophthirius multifiliis]|uniref:Transmembrane protein n=1 Tax=Ichthyophthirius multifiliis TaxID=5932 RepID=G0R491_ICHMU|nr:hypothetical protein IMG5_190580 [Ichthyophthirius multifiliis]EGR27702.1 hypothetical protein IMG5_190580 [Ichthyophthirius multifiliis]|eukprot:XP_004025154.1 hypothetical protein IMG5_190580 [Ichthyophthirius multifiliis]
MPTYLQRHQPSQLKLSLYRFISLLSKFIIYQSEYKLMTLFIFFISSSIQSYFYQLLSPFFIQSNYSVQYFSYFISLLVRYQRIKTSPFNIKYTSLVFMFVMYSPTPH